MKNDKLFTEGSVLKSLFKLGLPLILGQLINILYNIVDRIFIGNMKDVGSAALGGVGITLPIIVIVSAFAVLFGMGGSPLAAIKLGEDDKEEANKIMMNSFSLLIISGFVLTIILLIFSKQILYLFGITDDILIYGLEYLNIYALGTVFVMISIGLSFYISAQGYTKSAALIVLVGAVLNIILDPILIYTFNLGVKGAAIATIFSQGVSTLLIILFLISKRSVLKITFKDFKFNKRVIIGIISLGISPFIMQSTEALIQIVFNIQIVKYGGVDYIIYLNIMTIMMSVLQFMVMPVQGLTQGASPMISYNYGQGNKKRVKETYKTLIVLSLIYTLLFYIFIFLFPKEIARVFNNDPRILEYAPKIMRIFFLGMGFMGIQFACQATFMAVNQPVVSLTMAVLRKIVILVPLAFFLPLFLGINGIFYAEMIADFLAVIITFTTFMLTIDRRLDEGVLKLQYNLSN